MCAIYCHSNYSSHNTTHSIYSTTGDTRVEPQVEFFASTLEGHMEVLYMTCCARVDRIEEGGAVSRLAMRIVVVGRKRGSHNMASTRYK